ncbi:MAG: NAD(P)-dependent oxidoreductase [Chloroflexi bacterium]|nr:MAG: NAD(P)-dependent oxidoreductase [Chloroflexota bacterium]
MRVFITGGTGFLGTHLALEHANRGDQVVVLSKEATSAEKENAGDLEVAGVCVYQGSITDEELTATCLQGVERVYHIAAVMREANIPDKVFWEVNVDATRRLLDLSREAGVKRFVYCSSIGAMGKSIQKPADESSACKPEDIYQVTKRAAEEICLEYGKTHNFPISIVRPADVYGPRDRRLLKMFKGIRKGRFPLIGNGMNEHHMVYIDDMVQAFLLVGESEEAVGEIFIIAGEQPVSVKTLMEFIAKETKGSIPRIQLPLKPVYDLAVVVEKVCQPIGIQPPLYPRRVDFFRSDYAFDITKAKQVLGYQPRFDLSSGLRKTLEYYQQSNLL